MRIALAVITLGCLTFTAACTKGDSASDNDVTSDFINKLGGRTYTIGGSALGSEDTEITVLTSGSGATLLFEYRDADCPFVETATLNRVSKTPDGQNYQISYTDVNAKLLGGSSRGDCQDIIEAYRAKHLQLTETKLACDYSTDGVDFSCNSGRGSKNWVLKRRVSQDGDSDRYDRPTRRSDDRF